MAVNCILLSVNTMKSRKIRQMRKLSRGPELINIWISLLCLAGESGDSGYLYMADNVPYTVETLSIELEYDAGLIAEAITLFLSWKMIAVDSGVIRLLSWDKYQNSDNVPQSAKAKRKKTQSIRRQAVKRIGVEPGEPSPEDIVSPLGGLGKGVVFLSDSQIGDLLDRMDVNTFDRYIGVVAQQIEMGRTVKNAYNLILRMAKEDGVIQ